jgi:hypothetical protein
MVKSVVSKASNNNININNNTMLVGLLGLLVGLWLLWYIIPSLLFSLFHTFLGNLILLLILILFGSQNAPLALLLGLCVIIFYRFSSFSGEKKKEGFTEDSTNEFLRLQQTVNPQLVYDMSNLAQQVSQSDLDNYLQDGTWRWSEDVQDLYRESVKKNPYVRSNVEIGDVEEASKIYNEKVIMDILALQNKEGQLLASGMTVLDVDKVDRDGLGSYSMSSGLQPFNVGDSVIKCDGSRGMEQVKYVGQESTFATPLYEKSILKNDELENVIPGFKFTSGVCNPCSGLDGDYSCPFTVDSLGSTSNVWKYLWGK